MGKEVQYILAFEPRLEVPVLTGAFNVRAELGTLKQVALLLRLEHYGFTCIWCACLVCNYRKRQFFNLIQNVRTLTSQFSVL